MDNRFFQDDFNSGFYKEWIGYNKVWNGSGFVLRIGCGSPGIGGYFRWILEKRKKLIDIGFCFGFFVGIGNTFWTVFLDFWILVGFYQPDIGFEQLYQSTSDTKVQPHHSLHKRIIALFISFSISPVSRRFNIIELLNYDLKHRITTIF